jgi:hypothetical protein
MIFDKKTARKIKKSGETPPENLYRELLGKGRWQRAEGRNKLTR